MGVRTLAVYGLPLGLVASGALIERIGYPLTISVFAISAWSSPCSSASGGGPACGGPGLTQPPRYPRPSACEMNLASWVLVDGAAGLRAREFDY